MDTCRSRRRGRWFPCRERATWRDLQERRACGGRRKHHGYTREVRERRRKARKIREWKTSFESRDARQNDFLQRLRQEDERENPPGRVRAERQGAAARNARAEVRRVANICRRRRTSTYKVFLGSRERPLWPAGQGRLRGRRTMGSLDRKRTRQSAREFFE